MSEAVDYFKNHRHKLRFPWSLYHRPIVAALGAALGSSLGPDVLNVGSGPFFELAEVDATGRRISVCDIDERAIEAARRLHGDKIVSADVVRPGEPLPYRDESFDLVVSMDVIEHVPEPVEWTREVLRVLKPGGVLFLTTPNYASASLRVIENTALEAVARVQGFSRRHIHPTKMTPQRLTDVLGQAGAELTHIESIAFGWVLTAHARKKTG